MPNATGCVTLRTINTKLACTWSLGNSMNAPGPVSSEVPVIKKGHIRPHKPYTDIHNKCGAGLVLLQLQKPGWLRRKRRCEAGAKDDLRQSKALAGQQRCQRFWDLDPSQCTR